MLRIHQFIQTNVSNMSFQEMVIHPGDEPNLFKKRTFMTSNGKQKKEFMRRRGNTGTGG